MTNTGYFSSLFAAATIAVAPLLATSTGCIPQSSQAADRRDGVVETQKESPRDRWNAIVAKENQPAEKKRYQKTGEVAPEHRAMAAAVEYVAHQEAVAILVHQGKDDRQDPYEKGAVFMRGLARRGIPARIFVRETKTSYGGIQFIVANNAIDKGDSCLFPNADLDTEQEVRAAFQEVLQMFHLVHPDHAPALTKN